LLWTDGLKQALQVEELTDEDLSSAPEIDPALPCETWALDQSGWMTILGANMRGELLYYAGKYGQVGVDALVARLRGLDRLDEPFYRQVQR